MTPTPSRAVATYRVCGVDIAALTPDAAARWLVGQAGRRVAVEAHLCNAYTLSLVDQDQTLRRALESDRALNLADGTPVARIGRSSGMTGPVRGPSLVGAVASAGAGSDVRHYFYGGMPGVADEMVHGLRRVVPQLLVAGTETPPFTDLDDEALRQLADRVTASGADLLWVGLGTPRQDHLVARIAPLVGVPVVPVGAAFDFWAGRVAEAPQLLQGSGLEWVHRLVHEPRRLWRRYLIGNPRFILAAVRHGRRDKRSGRT